MEKVQIFWDPVGFELGSPGTTKISGVPADGITPNPSLPAYRNPALLIEAAKKADEGLKQLWAVENSLTGFGLRRAPTCHISSQDTYTSSRQLSYDR